MQLMMSVRSWPFIALDIRQKSAKSGHSDLADYGQKPPSMPRIYRLKHSQRKMAPLNALNMSRINHKYAPHRWGILARSTVV